jgi:hypothetical protein
MIETEQTPAPASPQHQCYERTFALLSKLAAGALVQVAPEHVQEFLAEIEHAHMLLRDAQLDRWLSNPLPEVYPGDRTDQR